MWIRLLGTILILLTSILSVTHGLRSITMDAADAKATSGIEIGRTTLVTMGVTAILSAFLTIMPQTFLLGSVMGGGVVYFIVAMQCRQHNLRGALTEIPFLLLPSVLLGRPSHRRDCQRM